MTSTTDTKTAGRRGPTQTNNEAVYQCFVDLSGTNPPILATKHVVARMLGVDPKIINDHIDRLLESQRIIRVLPGVFEPTTKAEIRAVSFTAMPDGSAKLEVGDQVLDLYSMREGWAAYGQLEGWLKSKSRGLRRIDPPKE